VVSVQNDSAVEHDFQTKSTYCSKESNNKVINNSVQLKDMEHHNKALTVFIGGSEDHHL